ncbi:MAG: dienelactone hydrolase family protein [Planctomycetota bacterium]
MKWTCLIALCCSEIALADEMPPASDSIPETYEALWDDDPRSEPLEVEVCKAWEEDDVTMQVIRFRVGTFKGSVARMAAVWGYPTGAQRLPGLLQIHGGGQYADANAVRTNAKRGYATLSIAWAGRINSPQYRVGPDEVRRFWDDEQDHPRYRLTTDWGAVDGYHAPSRFDGTAFPSTRAHAWTIDTVDSPRNSGWFLCAKAARRALTFLERQPQVDPDRLGVYGHSMGGKLTVMTATDPRVKAAAPSCGGISDRENASDLFEQTLGDHVYLTRIKCPIIFLSPANDFHGRIDDLQLAVTEVQSKHWRMSCSPHHNHQDTSPFEVATQLWFDRHLKDAGKIPLTPDCEIQTAGPHHPLSISINADRCRPIESVDVFFTRHGQSSDEKENRDNTMSRFWFHQSARQEGDRWKCQIDVEHADRPLWVYANVTYKLEPPITAAGYYYRNYTAKQFVLSSLMTIKTAQELQFAGRHTAKREDVIEDFRGDWRREWFSYRENEWPIRTHKVYEPRWSPKSDQAILHLEVRSEHPNPLVIGLDDAVAVVRLRGGEDFQSFDLSPSDFQRGPERKLEGWSSLRELRLNHREVIRTPDGNHSFGGPWTGSDPQFRNLRWTSNAKP